MGNADSLSVVSAVEVLKYAVLPGKQQLKSMQVLVNNTKTKSWAAQLHCKLNKLSNQRIGNQQLQRHALVPANPWKMLQLSLKNTKSNLNPIRLVAVLPQDVRSIIGQSPIHGICSERGYSSYCIVPRRRRNSYT